MILDMNYQHKDYIKDILPYIKNGILIDTSVIKILLDGLISLRISKKRIQNYDNLLAFLDFMKINNRWNKFVITPHILSEVCGHLNRNYRKNQNYRQIIEEILPILDNMEEKIIEKENIISSVEIKNPILEIGDISIFLSAKDFVDSSKKISILVKDTRFNREYELDSNVMIMDYNKIILNRI